MTGVLGVGNILLGDEGFGVHVVDFIREHYHVPHEVSIVDGGTSGIYMSSFISECSALVVVDAVNELSREPRDIVSFSWKDVKSGAMKLRLSPHQVGLSDVLSLLEIEGTIPEDILFVCVVPESLDTGIGLSDRVASKVPVVANIVADCLKRQGIVLKRL
jgi:hydrogenase maturation protease